MTTLNAYFYDLSRLFFPSFGPVNEVLCLCGCLDLDLEADFLFLLANLGFMPALDWCLDLDLAACTCLDFKDF